MTNTGGSMTPAGWYNDPAGSGHLRWWDGTAWSAHLAPQPTPAPAPVPTPVAPAPPVVLAPVAYEPTVMTADNENYVPFQGSWNYRPQPGFGGNAPDDLARPMQWNTAGAWLLAFSYLFAIVVAIFYLVVASPALALQSRQQRVDSITFASLWIPTALWILQVLFVLMDRRKLRSFGYLRTATVWWILLLPPLLYLIMRGVAVSREVRHGFAPLITYLVSWAVVVLLGITSAILIPAFLAQRAGGSLASSQFASSLETGLNEKGGHYTVTCPPSLPTNVGSTFTCTAIDATGSAHSLDISIVQGTDGKPTAKLLSVTPPIAN